MISKFFGRFKKKTTLKDVITTDKLPEGGVNVYTEKGTIKVDTDDDFLASVLAQCFVSGKPVIMNRSEFDGDDD